MNLAILSLLMSLKVTPEKIVSFLEKQCVQDKHTVAAPSEDSVRISAVQMRVRGYKNLRDYLQEMLDLSQSAVEGGAQMIVFPEYVGLLSAMLLPNFGKLLYWFMDGETPESLDDVRLQPQKTTALAEAFQNFLYECYTYTFSTLARLLHVYIVAGSCIVYEQGVLYNRSVIFGPDGNPVGAQDKVSALCFDAALGIKPCNHIEVFDTPIGKFSVILGSDAYYYENFRIAVDGGARFIIVPDGRGGVTADIVRCRADEVDVYAVYSCFTGAKSKQVRSCILAPFEMTAECSGTVARAPNSKTGYVSANLNLKKKVGHSRQATPDFLRGDYYKSYFNAKNTPDMKQDCSGLYAEISGKRPSIARTKKKSESK